MVKEVLVGVGQQVSYEKIFFKSETEDVQEETEVSQNVDNENINKNGMQNENEAAKGITQETEDKNECEETEGYKGGFHNKAQGDVGFSDVPERGTRDLVEDDADLQISLITGHKVKTTQIYCILTEAVYSSDKNGVINRINPKQIVPN